MKTLSVRQPWAELIVQGRKSLELRSWTAKYRGPLAIHASQTVERDACRDHGLDPDRVTTGAVIGVVDLVSVDLLDAAAYEQRAGEHLSDAPWAGEPLFGWRLANPRALREPISVRGRMALFDVALDDPGEGSPSEIVATDSPATDSPVTGPPAAIQAGADPPRGPARPMAGALRSETPSLAHFELRVLPEAGGAYRLALVQRRVEPPAEQRGVYDRNPPPMDRVADLGGPGLRAVADQVMTALRRNGYKPTDLSAARREPFVLSEETGVRLSLLFMAIRPITKMERIEAIARGVSAMTGEEAYYWYAKCTSGSAASRAQQALRVLLAEERP
jgi:hypothetical protein